MFQIHGTRVLAVVQVNSYESRSLDYCHDGYTFTIPFNKPWKILSTVMNVLNFYRTNAPFHNRTIVRLFDKAYWVE